MYIHLHLLVSIESLPSQWRNTIQTQQMMLWTSQHSDLAHQKQPEMIANVLMS